MRLIEIFTKRIQLDHWIATGHFVLIVLVIGFISLEGYKRVTNLSAQLDALFVELDTLSSQVEYLESGFALTTIMLEEDIADIRDSFGDALAKEKQNITAIKEQFGSFQEEVSEISGTVTTLEKLSKTDPELLQKYSKVFFLNEHYEPLRFTAIPNEYKYQDYKDLQMHSQVWTYLEIMLKQAQKDNTEMFVFSAFRSFDTQESLKGQYIVIYGAGTANQFSADQGYSEHQLGTTIDLITTGIGGTLPGFENTVAYTWLLRNAHKYGFVLSYPEDNKFYIFEPWHWRFVGISLAIDLRKTNRHFYDLDQREIDEYLVSLFD
ncbi:D-alanyl-D-alanine carboxypeptidase family protein [Patescibacteria group bacterium]|nr:D-alanyl-D-alanine carboxypeptidase family protein [Patescibacteria group bacterium]